MKFLITQFLYLLVPHLSYVQTYTPQTFLLKKPSICELPLMREITLDKQGKRPNAIFIYLF